MPYSGHGEEHSEYYGGPLDWPIDPVASVYIFADIVSKYNMTMIMVYLPIPMARDGVG